jgi:hypothetical protein
VIVLPDRTDLRAWTRAWLDNGKTPIGEPIPPGVRHLTIYRGQARGVPLGIEWTVHEHVALARAMAFVDPHRDDPYVVHARVHRRMVMGYLNDGATVIVNPFRLGRIEPV